MPFYLLPAQELLQLLCLKHQMKFEMANPNLGPLELGLMTEAFSDPQKQGHTYLPK